MIDRILKNPERARIPKDPAKLADLCFALGAELTVDNIKAVMPFIYRLPIEYQIYVFKNAGAKITGWFPEIFKTNSFIQWTNKYGFFLLETL